MSLKRWIIKEFDRQKALELSEECDINSFLSLLALNRNLTEAYEIDEFLSNDFDLEDPFSLNDMDIACERILKAIENNEKICIYGDYDCDGVTATAVLYSYLKEQGADVIYYIPNRLTEGYGMNLEAVNELANKQINLIITVDNGINAGKEVALANELGMDVVITDHHLPLTDIPQAVAVVDPHRVDDYSYCKNLSGVGVAFKLICALSNDISPLKLAEKYADIVTLGTIGDIVPLLSENRVICKFGLNKINTNSSVGISALKEVSGIAEKEINVSNISFILVPRINAAGRMGCSDRAVELLLEKDYDKALYLARELDEENSKRQAIGDKMFIEACEIIDRDNLYLNKVITVYNDDWHSGIIGIVASRLVEKYGRPCIVFSRDGDLLHGSGRSIEGFNIFNALSYCENLIEYFGGHELAAGLTIKIAKFEDFNVRINDFSENLPKLHSSITLDCKLKPEIITPDFVKMMDILEPFGAGNPEPVFGMINCVISQIEPIKSGKFVKIVVKKNGYSLTCLCFYLGFYNFPYSIGDSIDIAFTLDINEFRGREHVTLFIKDIRPYGFDEDKYFETLDIYDEFLFGSINSQEAGLILPSRDDFKVVFALLKNAGASLSEDFIINKLHKLSVGKINVILSVFLNLGTICKKINQNNINIMLIKIYKR